MLEYPLLTLLVIAPFAEKVQQAERQRQAVEVRRRTLRARGHEVAARIS